MTPYTFTLRRSFSANKMYANKARKVDALTGGRSGGRERSNAYKEWVSCAGWQMNAQGPVPQFLTTSVAVGISVGLFYYAGNAVKEIPDRFDLDNCLKPVCDLLVRMGAVADDSWQSIPNHKTGIDPDLIGLRVVVTPLGYRLTGKGRNMRKVFDD